MPPVQLLIKPASGSCNLRCKYCFYCDEMAKRETADYGFMSEETLEILVKKALEYADGTCGFAFQGGEPTLVGLDFYKRLLDYQSRYNTKQVAIHNSIQTNGFKLGEAWAEFLAENHFLVGVSLDGIVHTHDACRVDAGGNGTFAEIMKTLELFEKKQVDFNILTVVNRRTAEKIGRIYGFYAKHNWKYLQFIACLDPLGEPPGMREYSLTPEAYGDFLTELFDLWYLDWQKGNQPSIRMFENYIGILLGYVPEACDQRGCCSIQCVAEADGSVYPCDFYALDRYRMGSFAENTMEEMLEMGKTLGFVEESVENREVCERCEYGFICRGGCRRNRQAEESGKLGENYFCPAYKKFFKASLPRMRQIAMTVKNGYKRR